MASEDPARTRPGPVVLRIKLRYDDVDAMIQRFAPHVGRSGLFLPTRSLQPVGTEVKFELRLANDQPVLVGLGRVQHAKEPDPEQPAAAYGLGIELMRVTREGRELILKLLARRRELGLPDVALPRAEEIDAARREADTSGVPQPSASPSASQPVAAATTEPTRAPPGPAAAAAPRTMAGVAAPPPSTVPDADPSAAPPSAQDPSAQDPSAQDPTAQDPSAQDPSAAPPPIAPLAPLPAEPPRPKRRPVSELIESAVASSAAPLPIPALDEDIDVGKALARARALTGSDVERELEDLRDPAATPPVAISIEQASAELARQLGGVAVRRARSQGWAPPPAVATESAAPPPASESAAPPPHATAATDSAAPPPPAAAATDRAAAIESAAPPPHAAAVEATAPAVAQEAERSPVAKDADVPAPAADAAPAPAPAADAAPAPAADAAPAPAAQPQPTAKRRPFGPVNVDQVVTEPAIPFARGTRPAAAAVRAAYHDDEDDDEHTEIGSLPVDPSEEPTAFAALSALPAEAFREPSTQRSPQTPEPPEPATAPPAATPLELEQIEEIDEIDEFEILAEADAADADLLDSFGERDRPAARQPQADLDFAARLALGDDRDFYVPAAAIALDEHRAAHERAPLTLDPDEDLGELTGASPRGAAAARGAAPSHGGAGAARPRRGSERDLDPRHAELPPPHAFDQSDVIAVPPELRERPGANADAELESALEALDVDLDDLSSPHASTELHREPAAPRERRAAIRPGSAETPRTGPARQTGAGRVVRAASATPATPTRAASASPARQTGSSRVVRAASATPAAPTRAASASPARQTGSGRVVTPSPAAPAGRAPRTRSQDGSHTDDDDDDGQR